MSNTPPPRRQILVLDAVTYLYQNSRRRMAHWFWDNHVQVVARNALALGKKYKANCDYVVVGALLHDLADVWLERSDVLFESRTRIKATQILKKAGFSPQDIEIIITQVIDPHSCYPSKLPDMMEGKILATADAMAHLQTDFYPEFKRMGLPETINPLNFNEWARTKLERDFHSKIFFGDERESTRKDYERLKAEFV